VIFTLWVSDNRLKDERELLPSLIPRTLLCLEVGGEEKTPRIYHLPRILWRLEGSGAASEAAKSEKHPYFAVCLDFPGVLEEAALPLKPQMSEKRPDFAPLPGFLGVWKEVAPPDNKK
jgi:hypothetical protein